MSTMYGQNHVKAWHTNMPVVNRQMPGVNPPSGVDPSQYTDEEKAVLEINKWYNTKGNGYYIEQSTQPQTLGYSLSDSPVGLLAWIYEKLVTWSDNYAWDDDEGKPKHSV